MQSELQLQAQCFQWLWNNYPETRLLCWHVTNEMKPWPAETLEEFLQRCPTARPGDYPIFGYKGESKQHFSRRIAQAKAAGLVPGVWDLHFLWKGTLFLFEFKVGHNKLSEAQIAFEAATEKHGAVHLKPCYDLADFKERIAYVFQFSSH